MASGRILSEAGQLGYEALFDVIGRDLAMARPRCATMALDTLRQALRFHALRRLVDTSEASGPPSPAATP